MLANPTANRTLKSRYFPLGIRFQIQFFGHSIMQPTFQGEESTSGVTCSTSLSAYKTHHSQSVRPENGARHNANAHALRTASLVRRKIDHQTRRALAIVAEFLS